jgi:hypothetical protein
LTLMSPFEVCSVAVGPLSAFVTVDIVPPTDQRV